MPASPEPAPGADALLPRPFRVRRVRRETHDTSTLELAPLSGPPLEFAPGQFNMLYAFGKGEMAISISGDPASPQSLVHTVRGVGLATRAICELKPGDTLGVRGPYGTSWPVERIRGSDLLVIAGGIGLAPLRPALYRVIAERKRFGRVSLLYGARTPQELLYRRELQAWRGRFDLDVEVTVDHASGEAFENVGVVTTLIPHARFDPSDSAAFVCGPEIMLRFVVSDLLEAGLDARDIYVSMERNMQCAIGHCGHCQFGPFFVCKDGPVFRYADIQQLLRVREI